VYFDLDEANASTGPVRVAKKVLARTAVDLARHATYALALHELPISGASAGIHSTPEGRERALESFVAEVGCWPETSRFSPIPGTGSTKADLRPLRSDDPRHDIFWDDAALTAISARCAIRTAPPLDNLHVAVIASDAPELGRQLRDTAADVSVFDAADQQAWSVEADVLFIDAPVGSLNHARAGQLAARHIVPLSPLLVTARGLAVASRAGITIVPGFLSAATRTVVGFLGDESTPSQLSDSLSASTAEIWNSIARHEAGPFVAACELAEAFIATWSSHRPFGRPLAP
jgi:glutamate dehydrogenase/leucine dehydrogenase